MDQTRTTSWLERCGQSICRPVFRTLGWFGRHELITLVALVAIAGAIWGFAELSDEVFEGATQSIDRDVLLMMRSVDDLSDPVGPRWLEEMGRDITALGGIVVLVGLSLAAAGYLLMRRAFRAAILLAISVLGGWGVSMLLKNVFARPRPDLVPHHSEVYTASFPSGHSMMAAVTYLTLAVIVARVQPNLRIKAYLLALAVLIVVLVGVSRVYMGVHWPTDVLAGWTAGAAWALLCWALAYFLQTRGSVEASIEPATTD